MCRVAARVSVKGVAGVVLNKNVPHTWQFQQGFWALFRSALECHTVSGHVPWCCGARDCRFPNRCDCSRQASACALPNLPVLVACPHFVLHDAVWTTPVTGGEVECATHLACPTRPKLLACAHKATHPLTPNLQTTLPTCYQLHAAIYLRRWMWRRRPQPWRPNTSLAARLPCSSHGGHSCSRSRRGHSIRRRRALVVGRQARIRVDRLRPGRGRVSSATVLRAPAIHCLFLVTTVGATDGSRRAAFGARRGTLCPPWSRRGG